MKLKNEEIIALQNALDCLDHYQRMGQFHEEYTPEEVGCLHESIICLQNMLNEQGYNKELDRPFQRVYFDNHEDFLIDTITR